jgi:RNA polymerase sigma-70 factor (ECF subfamily)
MDASSDERFRLGRAAWPQIALSEDVFLQHIARCAPEDPSANIGDLYLACACLQGVTEALAELDRTVQLRVPRALAHMKLPPHQVDDLCQEVRERLLLPDGDRPPKLLGYAGRGTLVSWICVVALRAAVDQLRAADRRAAREGEFDEDLIDDGAHNPELELLKQRYRPRFKEALLAALAMLSSRQRNLLRLSVVEGLTLEQIAPIYAVTKSTAHRWLGEARAQIVAEVGEFLKQRVGFSAGELDSLTYLLQSQLDLSLPPLLHSQS